jgi:hypothetical protein
MATFAERLAPGEQALLEGYLRELCRPGADAVMGVNGPTASASRAAMQLLVQGDHAVLAGYAREGYFFDQPIEREICCVSDNRFIV